MSDRLDGITDEPSVAALYARTREQFGRIDVLFNNAGISPMANTFTSVCSG